MIQAALDELHEFVVLVLELLALQAGQLAQAHFHDGGGLGVRELVAFHQHLAGFVDALGLIADNVDNLVDEVHGLEEAFQDMGALLGFVQLELGAAHHNLVAEVHELLDDFLEAEGAGTAFHQRHVVEGEAGLQRAVLEQHVEHHAGVGSLLEADDHAGFSAGAFIVDVGDALHLLFIGQLGNLLNHLPLVHHVRDFRDHDGFTAVVVHLDFRLGADDHAAAAGFIGFLDAGNAHHDAAGREIRALDVLHELFRGDFRIVDVGADGVAALAQVVGSHVGGHTYGNTRCAVQEQQRGLGGQDGGFFQGVVEVEGHVHGVLVHVSEDVLRHLLELGLRVTHGSGRVTVHRAKVTLALHHGIALVPFLAQAHHGVIYAGVSVGVELTHHLTHDTGALLGLAAIAEAHIVHAEQDAALDRLEAVTGIREGTGNNHRHRIVDVCRAHFVVYLYLLDVAGAHQTFFFGNNLLFVDIHFLLTFLINIQR